MGVIQGLGLRVSGFRVSGVMVKDWCFDFKVSGFRVGGLGFDFRVQRVGLRV